MSPLLYGSTAQQLNGMSDINLKFITIAPLSLCAFIPPQIYKLWRRFERII